MEQPPKDQKYGRYWMNDTPEQPSSNPSDDLAHLFYYNFEGVRYSQIVIARNEAEARYKFYLAWGGEYGGIVPTDDSTADETPACPHGTATFLEFACPKCGETVKRAADTEMTQVTEPTKEQINELLAALDSLVTDYEYGLPMYDEGKKAQMREVVREWLTRTADRKSAP